MAGRISPEARLKLSELAKARWADPETRAVMMAGAMRGLRKAWAKPSGRKRPEPGTEARRIFEKIARNSNAATAHALFSRGEP